MQDIQFAPMDARAIEAAVIAGFESAARLAGQADFRLYPGDPRRLFLEAVALLITQQNALIDKTGKSTLLRYAGEDTIEDIGWLYGARADRLQPSAALTTIRFTLSTTRPAVTTIAAGTRLAVGDVLFATTEALDIPAGTITGDVTARCGATGPTGNGFLPGQINTLVDRNPFVDTAVNTTESAGGADREDLESYRVRVREAPESFSVAGPDGAYAFWGKTAHASIMDVAVWTPEPGYVNVAPLLEGGTMPSQEIMDAVLDILSDKTRRPLTDHVEVVAPDPVEYDITATYWIDQNDVASAPAIQAAVDAAVEAYRQWQRGKLGRDINPSELHRRMMNAGARRVAISFPTYTVLEQGQVAQDAAVDVRYGGLEHA